MEIAGEERIAAPKAVVWAALNDPDFLKACIPGCQSLEWTSETTLDAVVKVKLGILSPTFRGELSLSNLNPPDSYTLSGAGKGGIAGFAKGHADVRLTADGDETILAYDVTADVGGKLAQLGAKLVDGSAQKLAAWFFADLSAKLEARTL